MFEVDELVVDEGEEVYLDLEAVEDSLNFLKVEIKIFLIASRT